LPKKYADRIALEYCMLNPQSVIVNLHPVAYGKDEAVEEFLGEYGKVFYKKEIYVNSHAAFLITKRYYKNENWIGNYENNFAGARRHGYEVFKNCKNIPVRIYIYQCHNKKDLPILKSKIRFLYNLGNYPVHINDTHEETIDLAQLWLNDNSIHYINNASFKYYADFKDRVFFYKKWLINNQYNSEFFCIDGSSPLSVYGLRQSADLDFLYLRHTAKYLNISPIENNYINSHLEEAKYYAMPVEDIIINPDYHFYFEGVKFINLDVLKIMKTNRNEFPKDQKDIYLINVLLKNNILNFPVNFYGFKLYSFYELLYPKFIMIKSFSKRGMNFLKNRLIKLFPGIILSIPFKGFKVFYSIGNILVSRRIKKEGDYEKEYCEAIVNELRDIKTPTMIDIGANIGLISLSVISTNNNMRIYAFEPGSHQYHLFKKTINLSQLGGQIKLFEYAISNKSNDMDFAIHYHQYSSFDGFFDTKGAGKTKNIKVKMTTIDDWWSKEGKPKVDIIKMRIEGAELWALQGSAKLIKTHKPVIFLDINFSKIMNYPFQLNDLLDYVSDLDYQLYSLKNELLTTEKLIPLLSAEECFIAKPVE